MTKQSKNITLYSEERLTRPAQEIVTQLENWVNNRYNEKEFYSYFRWEVDCHHMTAFLIDDVGRTVFILQLD